MKSMTGFARSSGSSGSSDWIWEVKSLNARGLEVRLRLPQGYDQLEYNLRREVNAKISRGTVTANLQVKHANTMTEVKVNQDILQQISLIVEELEQKPGFGPARPDGVLGLRGVLEMIDSVTGVNVTLDLSEEISRGFSIALSELVNVRLEEGAQIKKMLTPLCIQVEKLIGQAQTAANASREVTREKIKLRIQELLSHNNDLSVDRLNQELVLFYVRADVTEELDRLRAHSDSVNQLLLSERPIGRRLDFICQEMNREANTICSKSLISELNSVGLELKVIVDRLREQVQNVE